METKQGKQILIGLIDASIATALLMILSYNKSPEFLYSLMATYNTSLIALCWFFLYRLIAVVVFRGTIGMKIFRVQFLNDNMKPPSVLEHILASAFILTNGVRYYDY
jgi:hypothetical protein